MAPLWVMGKFFEGLEDRWKGGWAEKVSKKVAKLVVLPKKGSTDVSFPKKVVKFLWPSIWPPLFLNF
jgi:hypothetical protein